MLHSLPKLAHLKMLISKNCTLKKIIILDATTILQLKKGKTTQGGFAY